MSAKTMLELADRLKEAARTAVWPLHVELMMDASIALRASAPATGDVREALEKIDRFLSLAQSNKEWASVKLAREAVWEAHDLVSPTATDDRIEAALTADKEAPLYRHLDKPLPVGSDGPITTEQGAIAFDLNDPRPIWDQGATASAVSVEEREVLAETIHKARWPTDRQIAVTPFADEDRNGREYCFRIADAVIAARARGEPQAPAQPVAWRVDWAPGDYSFLSQKPDIVGRDKESVIVTPLYIAPRVQCSEEMVQVPKAALDWLDGSAPDADGKWFGDCEPQDSKHSKRLSPRYWWRSKFRSMIPALSRPERG